MPKVEPSFVLYALLLEPGGCLRAHITLFELVEPEEKKKAEVLKTNLFVRRLLKLWRLLGSQVETLHHRGQ